MTPFRPQFFSRQLTVSGLDDAQSEDSLARLPRWYTNSDQFECQGGVAVLRVDEYAWRSTVPHSPRFAKLPRPI